MKLIFSILIFITVCVSCSNLRKDDIYHYEKGLYYYNQGEYGKALAYLKNYTQIDYNYGPLYDIIAHCYYEFGLVDSAFTYLDKSFSLQDKPDNHNLYFTLYSELLRVDVYEERIGFLQYINDVGERYGIDLGLILAIMNQESDFISDAVSSAGAVGLMQLMPETARILGLKVPEENFTNQPPIRDPLLDERFNPAKNISAAANHFNFLLNHYKIDNKTTNLNKALAAYLAGTLNVKDSIPGYAQNYVNRIQRFYREYRANEQNQRRADALFHSRNSYVYNPFVKKNIPREHNTKFRQIRNYYNSLDLDDLVGSSYDKAVLFNNLAIIAELLHENERAEEFYLKSLQIKPNDKNTLNNLILFFYDTYQYDKALESIDTFKNKHGSSVDIYIIQSSIYLMQENYSEAFEVLWQANDEFPNEAFILNNFAVLFFLERNQTMSDFYFQTALEIDANPIIANNYLVSMYYRYFYDVSEVSLIHFRKSSYLSDKKYIWPLDQRHIISHYGWRPGPFMQSWEERLSRLDFHNGIDIPAPTLTPVRAVADGIVTTSDSFNAGGETIFLRHFDNYTSFYLHMHERLVFEGETVKQGDIIGLVGSTGRSTGPHLHLGFFDERWRPVNPLRLLPAY